MLKPNDYELCYTRLNTICKWLNKITENDKLIFDFNITNDNCNIYINYTPFYSFPYHFS